MPGAIFGMLQLQGGIAKPPRRRPARALTVVEREHVSRGLAAGNSVRSLARTLHRAPSTVSREVIRNGGRAVYRAAAAERGAWQRAERPKLCRMACNERLRAVVEEKLESDWSPQQIAAWLRLTYRNKPAMHISHETIYRSLYLQARGVLRKELRLHLRRRRPMRRARTYGAAGAIRGGIFDAVSIAERPASIEDRVIPGHWEGDLIEGIKNSYIMTLVERRSRFVQLVKVRDKNSATIVRALTRRVRYLPDGLMESLTWDRGNEMAQHKRFTVATDVAVYFCDPASPWQRGSNENTNGLLRQYFPKRTDLSVFTQRQLNAVALRLNTRPRKTLGYATPAYQFATSVASTR
jgi:IS30 family transposase